jgi:DNA-binding response OmpR family regulator
MNTAVSITLAPTAKEFETLRLLLEHPGEVISRERFLDVVWGYTAFPTTRTVDRHIATLRSKLGDDAEYPRWIRTVHRAGYRFEKTLETEPAAKGAGNCSRARNLQTARDAKPSAPWADR